MPTPTEVTVNIRPQNRIAERLEIAARVIMLAYTAFTAWQVAKAICPPLAVHEQLLIARVRRQFAKPGPPDVAVPREAIREIYDETR